MKINLLKLLPLVAGVVVIATTVVSCADDNDSYWNKYAEWREANEQWLNEMSAKSDEHGRKVYTRYEAPWNSDAYVLMRYCNDRAETEGNLTPLYTSTVDVYYEGYDCDGRMFDSSEGNQTYGTDIARFKCSEVISGWTIALENMRAGDSVEVIIPYAQGYGANLTATLKPYSNLRFNIRLVDIPYYEI